MAQLSVGEVGFAGLSLARRNPKLVLQWAVVLTILNLTQGVLFQVIHSNSDDVRQITMAFTLLGRLGIAIFAVGCFRLVLQPGSRRWAGLQFGRDEVRYVVAFFLSMLSAVAGGVVVSCVLGGALWMIASLSGHVEGLQTALGVVVLIVALGGAVYCGVRLSLVPPSAFAHKRINLFESWLLTKGRFWSLFWTLLAPWPLIVLAIAPGHLVFWLIERPAGGLSGLLLSGVPGSIFSTASLVATPLLALAGAVNMLLMFAPAAEAYRRLALGTGDGSKAG
ncbi:hypothetical protein [Caulobacter sp. NIBR2454]|uniref:hypothetical protein n=1 Tax=Caulobacter sp. NIBR2454 TaxID=3015996 RepID=UPI0022B713D4|nr:hypothetical protein [Caulobacter sp. NIBR2454]